ncbi:PREDICTED: uncharacterized protein LOC109167843 [Ipomoea nil]|uniref:uncharacterized protein LOC109167843 n=1 Tax=Ipomoea nil TaxID=35883 RepID=UPI000901AC89|nr:PREDICTED: uncharacterized protein LOC109167843 [Ipomoea nil]
MKGVILDYYDGIFCTGSTDEGVELFDNITPPITHANNEALMRPFELDEVKSALFSMLPDKSPGSDGLNDTNVVLIPKKKTPEFVTDLRPIALCNVVYKIMTNMIANRMKPVLEIIIFDSWSAFIPDTLIMDNILVATKANFQEATEVKRCLSVYESLSGQGVNYHKSSICFSKNTREDNREEVAQVLGVVQASNFGKFLGLPSFLARNKKAAFDYIEDKIRQRIGSWNKKLLSEAGREILLKSIVQSMPTFSMSVFLLPISAWDRLCVPKKFGGLGFKELRAFNLAMLGKPAWRFLTKPESLVACVYKAKYYPKDSFFDACLGNNPSFYWHSIMAAQGLICSGVRRGIENGGATFIWGHPWIQDEQESLVQTEMPPQLAGSRVGDPKGCYSVKSGYRSIVGNFPGNIGSFDEWNKLWCLKIPPIWKTFLWRALSDILHTTKNLLLKRVDVDPFCAMCEVLNILDSNQMIYTAVILYNIWRARNGAVWEHFLPTLRRVFASSAAAAVHAWCSAQPNASRQPSTIQTAPPPAAAPMWNCWFDAGY